ncbi:hypothetical protein [Nostoc sp. PCC 7107]|uniref:hypothetical protein n=1 Tax=Nostoc sp. PCC 7107 TaxID=317936 RepID=UPI0002D48820|nr:hypothetical protein [Nostoc sp. PCC 7107]
MKTDTPIIIIKPTRTTTKINIYSALSEKLRARVPRVEQTSVTQHSTNDSLCDELI